MRYSVNQQIDDLNKVEWIFNMMEAGYGETSIFLENMYVMTRESTRHKYRIDNSQSYSRVHNRDMGIKHEPDVPIEIAAEAVQEMRKTIKFKQWGWK